MNMRRPAIAENMAVYDRKCVLPSFLRFFITRRSNSSASRNSPANMPRHSSTNERFSPICGIRFFMGFTSETKNHPKEISLR